MLLKLLCNKKYFLIYLLLFSSLIYAGCNSNPDALSVTEETTSIPPLYQVSSEPSWTWRHFPRIDSEIQLEEYNKYLWFDFAPELANIQFVRPISPILVERVFLYINDVKISNDSMEVTEWVEGSEEVSLRVGWELPINQPGLYVVKIEIITDSGLIETYEWHFYLE